MLTSTYINTIWLRDRIIEIARARRTDQRGAALVEYAFLLSFIVVVCVAAVTLLGTTNSAKCHPIRDFDQHRELARRTHNDGPPPDRPARHEALGDIGILPHEVLDAGRVIGPEHEDGAIGGVGECAGQHQFAPLMRRACEREVGFSQRCSSLEVVVDEVVQQQPVHPVILPYLRASAGRSTNTYESVAIETVPTTATRSIGKNAPAKGSIPRMRIHTSSTPSCHRYTP